MSSHTSWHYICLCSIFTFTFVSVAFIFVSVAFSFLSESSNVQSTQQSNVQRISKYFSTIYENRQYAQKSTNSQRINQHWSISQRNFIRYDDHLLSWYLKQSFNESSMHCQTYDQFESRIFCKELVDLIKIYKKKE
jgi:hypothetical protein